MGENLYGQISDAENNDKEESKEMKAVIIGAGESRHTSQFEFAESRKWTSCRFTVIPTPMHRNWLCGCIANGLRRLRKSWRRPNLYIFP